MAHTCPPREDLEALVDGALEENRISALRHHLPGCPSCRRVLDELAAIDAALITGLAELPQAQPRTASRVLRFGAVAAAAAAGLLLALQLLDVRAPEEPPIPDVPELSKPYPEEEADHVRVAAFEGDAVIRPSASGRPRELSLNEPLREGDLVRTNPGARAKLEVPERLEIYVNEGTELSMSNRRGEALQLRHGELFAKHRGRDQALRIQTEAGTVELLEGETILRARPGEVRLAVRTGRAWFHRGGNRIPLQPGEMLSAPTDPELPARKGRHKRRRPPAWMKRLQPVVFLDTFRTKGLSASWRAHPPRKARWEIREKGGRSILVLHPPKVSPEAKPRRAMSALINTRSFPIEPPVTFEFLVQQPAPGTGGVTAIVLGRAVPGKGRVLLRYVLSTRHESLDLRRPDAAKAEPLWKARRKRRRGEEDGAWVRLRLTLDSETVTLIRNGRVVLKSRPHGLGHPPPLRLHLVSVAHPKAERPFESRFGRISVRRD